MATFTNQATLTYDGGTTSSNIVSGEILEVLSATKTALSDTYESGETITYIISIVNSGATAYTGLTITDNLGAYPFGTPPTTLYPLTYVPGTLTYLVNGSVQPTPPVTAGPPLTITGINVPAGGNATLIYNALANTYAPLADASTITNTATISGGGLTPLTVTETVTAANDTSLTISKAISPETVVENGQLTYTFVIQNTGEAAVATDNITVSDTFNPILDPITVTFNGTPWTAGTNYTYDNTTGQFQTIAGQITVPGATYTQDPITGVWQTTPGVAVLKVVGTV